MEIIKIASIGILAAILGLYFHKEEKSYALYISLCAGIVILYISLSYLSPVFTVIHRFAEKGSLSEIRLKPVYKILATAYLAEFACDTCRDAGQNAIAAKIEMGARFMIVYFSLPVVLTLFEYITSLL